MRKLLHGAIAVPITAALLIAAAGCSGGTTSAAAATPGSSTSTSSVGSSRGATTGTSTATQSPQPTKSTQAPSSAASVPGSASASASSEGTSAPFPGIWDITSWQQYRKFQASVEQGHQPWLLDPVSVVDAWAARWGKVDLPVHQVGPDTYQVVEPGTSVTYTIRGTRPDPDGPAPIWVITSITHN